MRVLVAPLCALLLALAACRSRPDPRPCPAGFQRDDARAEGIFEALASSPEGADLLKGVKTPDVCFGEPAYSVVTTEGVLLMDRRLDKGEAAARVGHLLLHVASGALALDPTPGDAGCEAAVDAALRAEARAMALEIRLRRDLGVSSARSPIEPTPEFWRAAPALREALLLDYIRAHPDGAPGLDALVTGYTRRCKEAR